MTWEEIDSIIRSAEIMDPGPQLVARQIASEGRNPYYNFFRRLTTREKEAGIFLEIGCWRGCVAAHTLQEGWDNCGIGYHENLHLGIDINPVNYSSPGFMLIQADATQKHVADQVKALADYYGGIFCVFQDSSHHYEDSKMEWELYSPLVRPGGIWVADDITPAFQSRSKNAFPFILDYQDVTMVDYWNTLPGDKRLYDNLHHGSTMGIVLL